MKRSTVRPTLGAAAALTLLLTGCGVQASNSTATGQSASGGSAIDPSIGAQFSGGKSGKADSSATPITVGMINQEGGQVSDPEASAAVKAAFEYINASQSGVDGHPLRLTLCKVTSSEEEAQQCAQKFLNDSSIDVVLQGGLNVGADAVHSTLATAKPVVVSQANPGTDTTAADAFAVNPNVIASVPGAASYAKSKGYKDVGMIVDDNPGDLAIAQFFESVFQQAGVTAKVTTFPAGSTDLTAAFTAALASKPDAITPIVVTTAGCIAAAKAVQSLGTGTPVFGSNLCATQDVKNALGDFPKWAYEATALSLFAPDKTGQLNFYRAVMGKYAGSGAQLGIDAPYAFGAAFLLAKVLNTLGPSKITPESVASGLQSYTDGVLLYTPKVAFGSVPHMTALSGIADRFYGYQGNGNWTSTDWQNVGQ